MKAVCSLIAVLWYQSSAVLVDYKITEQHSSDSRPSRLSFALGRIFFRASHDGVS